MFELSPVNVANQIITANGLNPEDVEYIESVNDPDKFDCIVYAKMKNGKMIELRRHLNGDV